MARKVSKAASSTNNKKSTVTQKQRRISYEITTILTFTIGALLGISFFMPSSGTLGEAVKNSCYWLLGPFTSSLIPFSIIGLGILFVAKKQITGSKYKFISVFLLFWTISTICEFYGIGGGKMGSLIAEPMHRIFGVGGGLVLFSLMLVLIVIVFEVSVIRFFAWLGSGIKYGWELLTSAFGTVLEHGEDRETKDKENNDKYKKEIEEIEQDIIAYKNEQRKPVSELVNTLEKAEDASVADTQKEEETIENESETSGAGGGKYKLHPISLLKKPKSQNMDQRDYALEETANKLIDTLDSFGVEEFVNYSMAYCNGMNCSRGRV